MPRSDAVRGAPRSDAGRALSLAQELIVSGDKAAAVGHWRVAGLNAVHAGISAADAALIGASGVRSASQDHGAASDLLESRVPEFKTAQKRQLNGLLKVKNAIAYEQRPVTEVEARVMLDQARRFVEWASGVVDRSLS